MITLFGATGYTGRLVVRALARLGLPFRLAGRSPEKLARLAEAISRIEAGMEPPSWLIADAAQPETLPALCQDTRVLLNCAGPFTELGPQVVAQATLNGVHYLDTSNELGYVYQLQSYDTLALRSGAAIVPACGLEVALADCAAAVLCPPAGSGPMAHEPSQPSEEGNATRVPAQPTGGPLAVDEVSVVYDIRGQGSSLGSRRSAIRALATSWLGYQEGRWGHAIPCREGRRAELPDGLRPALSFPSSEIVTVPQHLRVRRVTTWMTVSWHALFWAPMLVPIFAWLARGPVGRLAEELVSRVFPPPETGLRSEAPFTIQVEVRLGEVRRTLTLTGKGVYDLTAEIVAYAAGQLLQPGYDQAGVLAPAVALDPQALLDQATTHWGVDLKREA